MSVLCICDDRLTFVFKKLCSVSYTLHYRADIDDDDDEDGGNKLMRYFFVCFFTHKLKLRIRSRLGQPHSHITLNKQSHFHWEVAGIGSGFSFGHWRKHTLKNTVFSLQLRKEHRHSFDDKYQSVMYLFASGTMNFKAVSRKKLKSHQISIVFFKEWVS